MMGAWSKHSLPDPGREPVTRPTLVVLPTYNEVENIETVLRRVRESVPDAHVLVVDDGSPDGTADLADDVARELGGISVLRRAGTDRARLGLPRRLPVGTRPRLRRARRDGLRPLARPGGASGAAPTRSTTAPTSSSVRGTCPEARPPDWPWARRAISRTGCRYAQLMLGLPDA